MKQRHDELVRFIRRTFGAATIALIAVVAIFLALLYQRSTDEGRAAGSREISRLARELDILALERQNMIRGHLLFGDPRSLDGLPATSQGLAARLDSLRVLTADEPAQQKRADRIADAFSKWDSVVSVSHDPVPGDLTQTATMQAAAVASEPFFREIVETVPEFLREEELTYAARTRAAHALDRVIVVSIIISLAIVLAALFLLRRRLSAQAQDLAAIAAALDLRNAQLIDQAVHMERQQAELEKQKGDLQSRSVDLQRIVDALQASEDRFRTLVDSLHDVVFTLGRDLRYTGMFGGTATTNPLQLDQYIGKTSVEILGPEYGQIHKEAGERALRGEPVTYDWSLPVAGSMRYYTATISPLRGPQGSITGVVGINRDCTEQVLSDKALSEARDQLRQAQRLDALGQLAGGVAHDFNNLLTIIMTYAAILQEDAPAGSDEHYATDQIRTASERAAALTRQLLAFSRRQVLRPRAVDLNATVGEVEKMLRRLFPPDVTLDIALEENLGFVMADPGQIEQVLVNLAINARDAMPDGGRLSISTSNVDLDGSYKDIDARALKGPFVMITVADTGVGMAPETVAKAFDPFFTTKEVGKGTGLGLATVHGIVEQSGGRVWLYSEPGRGSTFKVYLPRLVDPAEASLQQTRPAEELNGSETVLLIDDNEELRRVVKRMLVRAGYQVLEAANGAAGLAQLDRGARVDVVVSDVMMPELGGRAVVDAVRQRHQSVKVLLMSGYNYDTALRGMAQRGDVAFIEKPFTAEKLLGRLREVLGQTPEKVGQA